MYIGIYDWIQFNELDYLIILDFAIPIEILFDYLWTMNEGGFFFGYLVLDFTCSERSLIMTIILGLHLLFSLDLQRGRYVCSNDQSSIETCVR